MLAGIHGGRNRHASPNTGPRVWLRIRAEPVQTPEIKAAGATEGKPRVWRCRATAGRGSGFRAPRAGGFRVQGRVHPALQGGGGLCLRVDWAIAESGTVSHSYGAV
jgi:hypothetical protein